MLKFEGKLYPGFVEYEDGKNVYIDCLHTVGKASNTFVWPKIFRDVTWHDRGMIVTDYTNHQGTRHFALEPAV